MMNNYGSNDYTQFLTEPEKVRVATQYLILKAADAKRTIEELLYLLDLQEKAPWPDMLEKFSSVAATMSQLQGAFKKSAIVSSSTEDNGILLRSHVMVPQTLTLEVNPELQRLTEGRLNSWNHECVPDYLRTKPSPDVETEEESVNSERSSKQADVVAKQIVHLNKHVDSLMLQLQSSVDRGTADTVEEKAAYSAEDTLKLVRAVMGGDGLRVPRGPPQQPPMQQPPTSHSQQQPMQQHPMRR